MLGDPLLNYKNQWNLVIQELRTAGTRWWINENCSPTSIRKRPNPGTGWWSQDPFGWFTRSDMVFYGKIWNDTEDFGWPTRQDKTRRPNRKIQVRQSPIGQEESWWRIWSWCKDLCDRDNVWEQSSAVPIGSAFGVTINDRTRVWSKDLRKTQ